MESLLALFIVGVAALILVALTVKSKGQNLLLDESGRMRKVYIALSLYEEQYDSQPAPDLVKATTYDPRREDLLSEQDPFSKVAAKEFPLDPGLDLAQKSPFRISFSYIQNFIRNGKLKTKPWAQARLDPRLGILANEWIGSVQASDPFKAKVGGRVLRINTDGSVFIVKDRGGPKELGDPNDLFVSH